MSRLSEHEARLAHEAARKKKRRTPTREEREIFANVKNNPCRICGADRTEVHHIVPRSQWSKLEREAGEHNHPHNLMALCHSCHQDHHTTTRRVPRDRLLATEVDFATSRMGAVWVGKWYPCTT